MFLYHTHNKCGKCISTFIYDIILIKMKQAYIMYQTCYFHAQNITSITATWYGVEPFPPPPPPSFQTGFIVKKYMTSSKEILSSDCFYRVKSWISTIPAMTPRRLRRGVIAGMWDPRDPIETTMTRIFKCQIFLLCDGASNMCCCNTPK